MGDINSSHCYDLCEVEFACCDGSGGVNLTNITTINGMPPEGGFPTSPGAPFNSIQFNNAGTFGGSSNLIWDNVNQILQVTGAIGINTSPAFSLDVNGQVNSTGCYLIDAVPFACSDGAGGIDLTNITNINGSPYPPPSGGGGDLSNLLAGTCISLDTSSPPTVTINANVPCIQTPWLQNIEAAQFNLSNCGWIINVATILVGATGRQASSAVFEFTGSVMAPSATFNSACLFDMWVSGGVQLTMGVDNASPFAPWIQTRSAGTNALLLNPAGGRVGIGLRSPAYILDVNGDVNSTGCYRINGVPFACSDGSGGINLYNITNINNHPPGGGGGSTVTVSDTPPINPTQGNLWFDSGDTQLYIWYQDPNSGQWVPTINQCSGGGTPTPPAPPPMSVQWNNNGVFGGSGLLIWNNANTQLGVGTGNPAFTLDVVGALGVPTEYTARVMSTDTFCGFIIENSGVQGSGGESIISFRSQGVETAVISYDDDEDALIFWTGGRDAGESTLCCDTNSNVGVQTTSPACALDVNGVIRTIAQGNSVSSGAGLALYFTSSQSYISSYDWDAGAYQPLTIDSSPLVLQSNGGHVGIGTSTPGAILETSVSHNTGPSLRCSISGINGQNQAGWIDFYDITNGSQMAAIQSGSDGSFGNNLIFLVKPPTGAPGGLTEAIHITSTGNVGIAQPSPTRTLDINGDVNVQTYIYVQAGITCGGAGPAGVGTINVSGGYYVNGAPHMFITQDMWVALTTRIQTLEARLAG